MKHGVEMGSGAVIYAPAFINTGSETETHRQHADRISLSDFMELIHS
jgi:hypothetical protein